MSLIQKEWKIAGEKNIAMNVVLKLQLQINVSGHPVQVGIIWTLKNVQISAQTHLSLKTANFWCIFGSYNTIHDS